MSRSEKWIDGLDHTHSSNHSIHMATQSSRLKPSTTTDIGLMLFSLCSLISRCILFPTKLSQRPGERLAADERVNTCIHLRLRNPVFMVS